MNKRTFLKSMAMLAATRALGRTALADERPQSPPARDAAAWAIDVSVLESCSCPPFCACFFTGKPPATAVGRPGHDGMAMQHVCRFNQAYRVNSGHAGSVRFDGARFWFAGDAGDDFDKPKLEWARLTFDTRLSAEQRDALLGVLRHLRWYRPERWKEYSVGPAAPIEWSATAEGAHATLGGGAIAETKLTTMHDLNASPVTISNMGYFGYPRNTGFILMPSDILAYRQGDRAFDYVKQGTNGLLTTLNMNAADFTH